VTQTVTPTATITASFTPSLTNTITPSEPETQNPETEVITIIADSSARTQNQFYFLSEDSSNNSSLLSRTLSSFPQWPEGATGFSVDSLTVGTANNQSSSLVTGIDIKSPQTAGNVAVGPFLRKDRGNIFVGNTKTFQWQGASDGDEIEPTATTEIPIQFSGNAAIGSAAPEYLFDFGLAQWNSSSSTVTDVAMVQKNSDNPDIIFKVKVFSEVNDQAQASQEAFAVTFSGRWHF
jgi:hypothetical protein